MAALAFGGCALFEPRPRLETPAPGDFALAGRLGVNRGEEGFSSNFLWRHSGDDFEIELWGPLGQGRTRLVGRDGKVTIHTSEGQLEASDTAATMERWLGISVPVAALVHWVQGEPMPGTAVRDAVYEGGDLVRLRQLDWELDFSRYAEVQGVRVPGRVVARNDTVKVTLLPRDWSFAPRVAAESATP